MHIKEGYREESQEVVQRRAAARTACHLAESSLKQAFGEAALTGPQVAPQPEILGQEVALDTASVDPVAPENNVIVGQFPGVIRGMVEVTPPAEGVDNVRAA